MTEFRITDAFVDTVGRVGFVGGVVRIELVTLQPGDGPKDPPKPAPVQRIVMPLEGFVNAFISMESLMRQLEQAGLISKKSGKGAKAVATGKAPDINPETAPV